MKNICLMVMCSVGLVAWSRGGAVVDYEVDGVAFEGYAVHADEKDAPMVLLIHDWDGLTDYEIKRAKMLADEDYSVFCADLYGKGVRPTELADKKKCMTMLTSDRAKMRAYMNGALAAAKEQGFNTDRCVAMGYCFGGTAVLEWARSGVDLDGFATFHGGLALPEGQNYSATKGPVIVMHGTADSMISMDDFAALANDLEGAGVPHQMITYGGAPHGWTVFGSKSYRERQDEESWEHFTEFLDELFD